MDRTGTLRALHQRLLGLSSFSMQDGGSAPEAAESVFIVDFYSSTSAARDVYGRTLSEILSWPDEELEMCHDYIQILFPLPEGSPFNMAAPVIDEATYRAFHDDEDLRGNLRSSLKRMLHFYGFEVQEKEGDLSVVRHSEWQRSFRNWVRRFDHNHLRITRIIRSLRCLGLEKEALAFYEALKEVYEAYGIISNRTMAYWTRAIKRPLRLAPDDYEEAMGVKWLRKIEEENSREIQAPSNGEVAPDPQKTPKQSGTSDNQEPEKQEEAAADTSSAEAEEKSIAHTDLPEDSHPSIPAQEEVDVMPAVSQEPQAVSPQVEMDTSKDPEIRTEEQKEVAENT